MKKMTKKWRRLLSLLLTLTLVLGLLPGIGLTVKAADTDLVIAPYVKAFTVPSEWENSDEIYTIADLPDDFVTCTDEQAAAWASENTDTAALLIYSIDAMYLKDSSVALKNEPTKKSLLYLTASNGAKIYYTAEDSSANVHTHDDITFTAWTAADSLPTEAGSYYLANDVDLGDSSWNVADEISLCLNGHSITADNDGSIIEVNGILNLYDEEGDLGVIGGNTSYGYGTGIRVRGELNMYGGQVANNTSTWECGGIYVDGIFNLYGGKIVNNKGNQVGGVYVASGSMSIAGDPEISGNIDDWNNKSNLFLLRDDAPINIVGPLTNTSETPKIGLRSSYNDIIVARAYNTYNEGVDPSNFFAVDDQMKKLTITESGDVKIGWGPVKYVEYNKETGEFEEKECTSYEVMDSGNYDAWSSGWYVITEDATITSGFNSGGGGPNNFILLDGVKLTLNGYGFSNGASTNIYGQGGENKPKIVVNNTNNYALILSSYNLTINAVDLELHGLVGGDFQTLTLNGCDAVVNNMTPSWQKTVWGASVELNKSTLNIEAGEEVNLPYVICGDYDNYAPVKVVVNDSDLTVKGGTAAAIRATNGIEVNSGTLTAVGGTQGISNDTPLKMATDKYLYGGDDEESMEGLAKGTGENITIDETIARKYMQVNGEPFHKHVWTYQADGASITASCDGIGDECTLTEGLTLTINAPTELTYDGNTKAATLSEGYNAEAFPEESTVITYEKDGNAVEAADVKNVGTYKAKVTIGEVEAFLEFEITPVDKTELNIVLSGAERFYDNIKQDFEPIATELKSAIDDAKKVADNDNVLESDVSAATEALNFAIYKAHKDVLAVDDAAEDIENLVDIEYITPDNIEDVKAALYTYDQLTDIQKNTIDKNIGRAGTKKIEDIEKALAVVDRIEALKNTEDIEAGDEKAVSLARTAYDLLTDAQKELISDEILQKLLDAEEALDTIKEQEVLDAAKAAAIERLRDYAAAKTLLDATPEEKASVNTAVNEGIDGINAVEVKDDVAAALSAAKAAVDAALAKINEDRAAAKAAAEEMEAADKALEDADAAAEEAKKAAEEAAKDPYASDEDKAAISTAKEALDNAVEAADDLPVDATAEQKKEAAKAIADAAAELDTAVDTANVNSAAAKAEAEAAAYAAAQLQAAKDTATDRLQDYADAKALADANEEEKKAYEQVAADGKKAIEAAKDKAAVADALTSAKAAVDAALAKIDKDRADSAAANKAAKELVAAKKEAETAMNEEVSVTQKGKKFTVKWKKVTSADGYYIYAQYEGKKATKPAVTITKNATTKTKLTKINGKKISTKKNFYVYVVPFKTINGKKVELGKSTVAHLIGVKSTKYSNVKNLTLTKSKYTVKVGKTAKIKAKVTLVNKNKKHIPKSHGAKLRYKSSDTSIATIDKNGKIKGIKKGTCTIYVYSINGLMKKAKVTIK